VSTSPTLDALLAPCDRFVIVDHQYETPDGATRRTKGARCFTPDGGNPVGIVGEERVLRGLLTRQSLREDPGLGESAVAL
jgi:hypothetical protein